MLSGVQHFLFCRRQWALIHIENLWAENLRTTEGEIMHERTHNEALTEKRGNTVITRGMSVFSRSLGVSGKCDVLEFHRDDNGVQINGWEGLWLPFPVEYKRGEPKENNCDAAQLCAQALCLEEMLCCEISQGALFYGETRRRLPLDFTPELKSEVK
ncbi:MAG: CRISPR-associated protein Cas4, partial [Oscillospiraceae bacterium]